MNVLTDPISIWHLLLVVGVIWLYFWNEQRKLKQEIKEQGERVEELYRENAELKDVCIMAFLGLHDLSRRIFQSAAI